MPLRRITNCRNVEAIGRPFMKSESFPRYRLIDDESQDLIVLAEDVRGFFGEQEVHPPEVTFIRVHQIANARRKVEDANLEVVNSQGVKIGDYCIGRVVRTGRHGLVENSPSNATYQFLGGVCEYSAAGEVWQHWASKVDGAMDEWIQWPSRYHETWLHVVQNSWFASGKNAASYGLDEVVYLDGANIFTKSSFYCALGEAVNGPRGYFGSNLDAVADCLSPEGTAPLSSIVWRNYQASRDHLGDDFMESIHSVMREFHVEVIARQ